MSHYPVVLIPSEIQSIAEEFPPISYPSDPKLEKLPEPPPKPGNKPLPVEWSAIQSTLFFIGLSGFLIAMATSFSSVVLGFLILLSTVAIMGWKSLDFKNKQINSYDQRLEGWSSYGKQYTLLLESYNQNKEKVERRNQKKLDSHRQDCLKAKSEQTTPEFLQSFRRQKLENVLRSVYPPDGADSNAPKGRHEPKLFQQLKYHFEGKIHQNTYLNIPDFEHPYSPDIAYIDPENNLHIDIEVDEPYAVHTKQPHHYIGKDDKRNYFFLNRYWVVIRFSEEQVVFHTLSCCKVVAQTIANITTNKTILDGFNGIPDLPDYPQWTYEEAEKMAKEGYRSKYKGIKINSKFRPVKSISLTPMSSEDLL